MEGPFIVLVTNGGRFLDGSGFTQTSQGYSSIERFSFPVVRWEVRYGADPLSTTLKMADEREVYLSMTIPARKLGWSRFQRDYLREYLHPNIPVSVARS